MAIGGVVIQWSARTRDAVRDVDKLTRSVRNVGSQATSAGGILKSSLKAGAAGLAVAAVGAGVAFVDMAKAAYADAQAQDNLERTLKRIKGITDSAADSTGAWIDSMELLTGISDDDLRAALGRLAVVTGDLTKAQVLSTVAADASVASGKEFKSVFNAMAKAAGGNTAALKKLFPELDAGPDKVLSLQEAVDQLTTSYGGAAKAAEDNDLFGRLGTIWGQLKEALGSAALPLLEDLAAWFSDSKNITALQGWITEVGNWATTVGEDFAGEVKGFIDWLQSDAGKNAIAGFTQSIADLGNGAKEAWRLLEPFVSLIGDLLEFYDRLPAPLKGLVGLGEMASSSGSERTSKGGGGGTFGKSSASNADVLRPGSTVNVTINNPKAEKVSTSIAAAIRAGKYLDTKLTSGQ